MRLYIYHCWTTDVLNDCLTWENNVVSSNNAFAILWGTIASNKEAKDEILRYVSERELGSWVGGWGRGQAKGCKLFINSGQMWSRRLVKIQKALQISDAAKTRDLSSSNRNVLVNPHTLCYRISTFTETQAISDIFAVFGLILQYFAKMTLSLVEQEGID